MSELEAKRIISELAKVEKDKQTRNVMLEFLHRKTHRAVIKKMLQDATDQALLFTWPLLVGWDLQEM